MAELKTDWTQTPNHQGELRELAGNVKVITPDARKYHPLPGGTMIPLACTDGSSSGFDCHKPGKVSIDPYPPGPEAVEVDFSKLTPEQLEELTTKIHYYDGREKGPPPRGEIADVFTELAKQQQVVPPPPVSFLRRFLTALGRILNPFN